MLRPIVGWILAASVAFAAPAAAGAKYPLVPLPIVGCPSDGQVGPESPPPHGRFESVRIDPRLAPRLAYYESAYAENIGPRGWHCFSLEGSNGVQLLIAQMPLQADLFFKGSHRISGPAIHLASMSGETSGRFDVARLIARYFPAHRGFVDDVIAEKIEPARDFPSGPYPSDKFIRRGPTRIEVETPPLHHGLGTSSWLDVDELPIVSMVRLDGFTTPDEDTGTTEILVKLPPGMQDLLPAIIGDR